MYICSYPWKDAINYVEVHTCTSYIIISNKASYFQYGHSTVVLWLLYNILFQGIVYVELQLWVLMVECNTSSLSLREVCLVSFSGLQNRGI